MSHQPRSNEQPAASHPDELFCIHSYAGEAGPPCGWRGPVREATRCVTTRTWRCPRCGRATLLEIPAKGG